MKLLVRILVLSVFIAPSQAATGFSVGLTLDGDVQKTTAIYACTGETELTVTYLNASPNFLAVIPVNGEELIFVNTLSASGAKYEAGQYIWWSKGADATLSDITEGLDAAPVLSCAERIETP